MQEPVRLLRDGSVLGRSGGEFVLAKAGGPRRRFALREANLTLTAVNARGQAVGFRDLPPGAGHSQAAVLVQGGRVYDLNALTPDRGGWHLSAASDINDRGQIICSGRRAADGGTYRGGGLLLTPRPQK